MLLFHKHRFNRWSLNICLCVLFLPLHRCIEVCLHRFNRCSALFALWSLWSIAPTLGFCWRRFNRCSLGRFAVPLDNCTDDWAWFCQIIRCSITGSTDALWSLFIGSTGARFDCCRLCSLVEPTPFKLKRRINRWFIPCCFCAALRGCFRGRSCLLLGLLCVSVPPL